MSTHPYSDLEVISNQTPQQPAGLEAIPNQQPALEYDHYHPDQHPQKQLVCPTKPNPDYIPISEASISSKEDFPPSTEDNRICGLSPRNFWIVAIALALLIGIAVGGGVGGSLSLKPRSPSNPSEIANTTTTSPTPTPSPSKPTLLPPTNCPTSNQTLYTSSSQTFLKTCSDTVYVTKATSKGQAVNTLVADYEGCVDLCAAWNVRMKERIGRGEVTVCNAVCWRNGGKGDEFPGRCFGYGFGYLGGVKAPAGGGIGGNGNGTGLVWSGDGKCDAGVWVDERVL